MKVVPLAVLRHNSCNALGTSSQASLAPTAGAGVASLSLQLLHLLLPLFVAAAVVTKEVPVTCDYL